MCLTNSNGSGKSPLLNLNKTSNPTQRPPSIVDTSQAGQAEAEMRRKRAGYGNLYKSGSRRGDTSQPSLSVKQLMGA